MKFQAQARKWFKRPLRGRGEYIGDALPSWVQPGVRLRVKSTASTREYGLQIISGRDRTWPNEIGLIRIDQGANESAGAWWRWRIDFPRGLSYVLDKRLLSNLTRVRP